MNNLELWEQVCRTDPSFTKHFRRGGGFEGTAINATHLVQMATEKFGPMGTDWGLEIIKERYIEGAPIIINDQVICKEVIHVVRAKLWYTFDGRGRARAGEIIQFGATTFIGKNKYGVFTDEEAPKKSLTDALTKCLSWLGFAADVHTGMYDDNKYVSEVKAYYENKKEPKITSEQIKTLEEKLNESGANKEKLLAWAGIKKLSELPTSKYGRVIAAIEEKQRNETVKQSEEKSNGNTV